MPTTVPVPTGAVATAAVTSASAWDDGDNMKVIVEGGDGDDGEPVPPILGADGKPLPPSPAKTGGRASTSQSGQPRSGDSVSEKDSPKPIVRERAGIGSYEDPGDQRHEKRRPGKTGRPGR